MAVTEKFLIKRDWPAIGELVRQQQRARESHTPTISAYRWWARRSHALIGELVDGASELFGADSVISDPMSGGGTVAIEAARRGLKVYAQDINPWATFSLSTILTPVDASAFNKAASELSASLEDLKSLYSLRIQGKRYNELVRLRVRAWSCPECRHETFLFPSALVTLETRIDSISRSRAAWIGCRSCGTATRAKLPAKRVFCAGCDATIRVEQESLSLKDGWMCAHCDAPSGTGPSILLGSRWQPVLSQVEDGKGFFFNPIARNEESPRIPPGFGYAIPTGTEFQALHQCGFKRWSELFTPRQLRTLVSSAALVHKAKYPEEIANRLLLCIAGAAEMAGHACRWDPRYLKVYEATANHHYSRTTLAAEVNLLSPRGRGTILRRIAHMQNASEWFSGAKSASVAQGSSAKQPIRAETIDVAITDPPYYGAVHYGELSRLFTVVGSAIGLPMPAAPDLSDEAVPRSPRHADLATYQSKLIKIMKETARTLKPDGRLVLTFHHSSLRVWSALCASLIEAELSIRALAVAHSENETDYSKRTRDSFTSDLILECAKGKPRGRPRVFSSAATNEHANLIAVGLAMAEKTSRAGSTLEAIYLEKLKRENVPQLFTGRC